MTSHKANAYREIAIRDFYHDNIGSQYSYIRLDNQDTCFLEIECDTGLPDELLTANLKIYVDVIMTKF